MTLKFNEYEKVASQKGSFLKLKEGENRIRLVSEAGEFTGAFQGKPKQRYVAYFIDRTDGNIKPFEFGPQILEGIGKLAASSETGFDVLPPYDFIVSKSGSGKETEYTVLPSRQDTKLTEEESAAIAQLPHVQQLADKLGSRAATKIEPEDTIDYGSGPDSGEGHPSY